MIALSNRYGRTSIPQKVGLLKALGHIEQIEEIAHEAFQNKGEALWKDFQFTLFSMNMKLLKEGFALGSPRSVSDWNVRNIIERVEQKYFPREETPAELDLK